MYPLTHIIERIPIRDGYAADMEIGKKNTPVGLCPTGFKSMDVLRLQNLFSLYDKNGNTEIYTISGF